MEKITIKEIAKLAGCSRGTVDRALRDSPNISPATKKRIMKIIEDTSYKPNLLEQALARVTKTFRIAIVTFAVAEAFYTDIIKGVNDALSEFERFGVSGDIFEINSYNIAEQYSCLQEINWDNYEALIVTPIDDEKIVSQLEEIARAGILIVTANADIDFEGKLAYIGCDYIKSGRTLGGLVNLLTSSKSCILVTIGSKEILGHNQRVQGILDMIDNNPNIEFCGVVTHNDNDREAYVKVKQMLYARDQINLICSTTGGTFGAAKAIREINRPIKLIAFDRTDDVINLLMSGEVVATIDQEPYEQGYTAVKLLYDYEYADKTPNKLNFTNLTITIKENI